MLLSVYQICCNLHSCQKYLQQHLLHSTYFNNNNNFFLLKLLIKKSKIPVEIPEIPSNLIK